MSEKVNNVITDEVQLQESSYRKFLDQVKKLMGKKMISIAISYLWVVCLFLLQHQLGGL